MASAVAAHKQAFGADLVPGCYEDLDLADLVVERVYADVPRAVWPAARLSVLAQLDYLGLLDGPAD